MSTVDLFFSQVWCIHSLLFPPPIYLELINEQIPAVYFKNTRIRFCSLLSGTPWVQHEVKLCLCFLFFSPWRIVDDCGGAFTMGAIGGGIFQAVKGFRNAPSVSSVWTFELYVCAVTWVCCDYLSPTCSGRASVLKALAFWFNDSLKEALNIFQRDGCYSVYLLFTLFKSVCAGLFCREWATGWGVV